MEYSFQYIYVKVFVSVTCCERDCLSSQKQVSSIILDSITMISAKAHQIGNICGMCHVSLIKYSGYSLSLKPKVKTI